jgi:hypothetical protein
VLSGGPGDNCADVSAIGRAGTVSRSRTVHVDRTRDQVKDSPAFDPDDFGRRGYREQIGSCYAESYRRG